MVLLGQNFPLPSNFNTIVTNEWNALPSSKKGDCTSYNSFYQYKVNVYQETMNANLKLAPIPLPLGTSCGSGDFENDTVINTTQWGGRTGTVTWTTGQAVTQFTAGVPGVFGAFNGAVNVATSRQTIVSSGFDNPNVPVNRVAPVGLNGAIGGSQRAVRLGNSLVGAAYESLEKRFVVTNPVMRFWFALVLQSPNHALQENPGFRVIILNNSGTEITGNRVNLGNGTNVVQSAANNPYFQYAQNNTIAYRDWGCSEIDLSGLVGQTITVQFINNDCTPTGHYGYTYLDNICAEGPCPLVFTPSDTSCSQTCFWRVTGNNIANNRNIFGTLTNHDIRIVTNNNQRGVIKNTGEFGLGTMTPTTQFHTTGGVRFQGINNDNSLSRIMAQDVTGNVFWRDASTFGSALGADQGVTIQDNMVNLGDYCGNNGGIFKSDREINMEDNNLYFNSGILEDFTRRPRSDGKIFMGGRYPEAKCRDLYARLEIDAFGIQYDASGNLIFPQNAYISPAPSTSGLRFTSLTMNSRPIENKSEGVLSLDEDGDVIWVQDRIGGSLTNSCTTQGFIPSVSSSGSPNLGCSQIFDNGTGVGISSTGPFTYSLSSIPPFSGGTVPTTGSLRLDVNGVIRCSGIFATSDESLKSGIKSIENANSIILSLSGKTYTWNKKYIESAGLDNGRHYGFMAQEVEKIMPEAVIKDKNGQYAVEYNAFIPVLVESQKGLIKETEALKVELAVLKSNNDLLKEKLALMEKSIAQICESGCVGLDKKIEDANILYQSFPNPTDDMATISYNLISKESKSEIKIISQDGKVLKVISLESKQGKGSVKLSLGDLANGTYLYSLVIDSKTFDTKRLQVVKIQ